MMGSQWLMRDEMKSRFQKNEIGISLSRKYDETFTLETRIEVVTVEPTGDFHDNSTTPPL
jgi:hypothetical protein